MARPIWNGTISFGLVSIPVELFTCTADMDVHFHMVTPDGKTRLERRLVIPDTGKEIAYEDTARGYEIADGKYVVVTPEELQKLQPETGSSIELDQFVDVKEVDPVYFERTYYAFPKKGGAKAYWLLHRALIESQKIGIGEFIMREKEHIAALRAGDDVLYVDCLYYEDEIKKPSEFDAAAPTKANPKEVAVAVELIEKLSSTFKPSAYKDDYRHAVLAMIKKKAKGKHKIVAMKSEAPKRTAKVIDLMERLQASLKAKPKKKAAKSAPPKKRRAAR